MVWGFIHFLVFSTILELSPFLYCLTAQNNLITAFRLYRWLKHLLINVARSHNLLYYSQLSFQLFNTRIAFIYKRSSQYLPPTRSFLIFCSDCRDSSNPNQHVPFPSTLLLSSKKVSMSPPRLASKTSLSPKFPMAGSSPLCQLSSRGLFTSFGTCNP
jgi:hypothetical protein